MSFPPLSSPPKNANQTPNNLSYYGAYFADGIVNIVEFEHRQLSAETSCVEDWIIKLCEWKMKGEVFSSPVMHGDLILIGCRDDKLWAYKMML